MFQVFNFKIFKWKAFYVRLDIISVIHTFIFLVLFNQSASSQDYNYEIQTIPLKGEFINFSGLCFLQDRDGFMWFGSREGLYCYQGTDVKVYRHLEENAHSLLDNFVYDLFEDSEGVIWIGTGEGLNRFDKKTETFINYKGDDVPGNSIVKYEIFKITEDRNKNVWIASATGFCRFERETGSFENYSIPRDDSAVIKDPFQIFGIFPDDEDNLWLNTGNGIYRFDIPSRTIEKIKDVDDGFSAGFYKDRSGRTWFISSVNLYMSDTGQQAFKPFIIGSPRSVREESQQVTVIIEDHSDNIWIRTLGGIYCYSQQLNLKYSLKHSTVYPLNYRSLDITRELFVDNTGNIWFYTPEGINQIIKKSGNFRRYDTNIIVDTWVNCIYIENEDLIWFGTLRGMNSLVRSKNEYTLHRGELMWQEGFPHSVETMKPDKNGIVWIGTWTEGLLSMSRSEKGDMLFRKHLPDFIDAGNLDNTGLYGIKYIFKDTYGRLWIDTYDYKDLHYFDPLNNTVCCLSDNPSAKDRLPKSVAIRHQTGTNTLWAIGRTGIYKIILPLVKNSSDQVVPTDVIKCQLFDEMDEPAGIPFVNVSLLDSSGIFWLGTDHGLLRLVPKSMSGKDVVEFNIKTYALKNGLPDERIMSIMPDDKGNLWMGTINGLTKFITGTETFTNYFVRHGLPVNEFKYGSATKSDDGELFFGTIAGMISFYPDSVYINPYYAPVWITGIRIKNELLLPGKDKELDRSVIYTDRLDLHYDQNNISVEYAILNYNNPELNQYRYKLEGFNDEWVYAGNRTNIDFTNLRPGKYNFHVSGSNNDGIWNEEGRSLGIIIHRPPWSGWYAWLIYAIIVGGIIFWYWRFLQKRARLRLAIEVERVEKEKVLELDQMKSRFFANISHEFRTPLTLISGPLEDLGKQEAEMISLKRNVLDMMQRNTSKLRNLINQLLDLSKMETGTIKLQVAEGKLEPFLRSVVLSFLSLAESKKIRYQYNLPESGLSLWFDADKLEKILVNLISNAFKFTPEQGEVRIEGKYSNREGTDIPEYLVLTVTDTGIGIPADKLDHIFDRFYQVNDSKAREAYGTGIGLALVKEMLEIYCGKINVHSKVGEGTTFTARIPVSGDLFREDEKVFVDPEHTGPVAEEPYMEVTGNLGNIPDQSGDEQKPLLLIVEDNPDMADYIAGTLDRDYRLARADNGKLGFDLTMEIIPDLVISDLMMPVMDGMEMCSLIKSDDLTSHIPVIMLTAKADRDSKLEGLKTGADDYLVKPFDAEELQVRIQNLIEQRNKLRKKFRKEFMSPDNMELPSAPDDPFLGKLLKLIESRHSDFEFSVDEMYDKMHMGRTQFFLKVHALTGESPNELLRFYRIKQAASMLRSGTDNITTIMYEVGFRSTSHFANSFKKYFGVNPSAYREGGK